VALLDRILDRLMVESL